MGHANNNNNNDDDDDDNNNNHNNNNNNNHNDNNNDNNNNNNDNDNDNDNKNRHLPKLVQNLDVNEWRQLRDDAPGFLCGCDNAVAVMHLYDSRSDCWRFCEPNKTGGSPKNIWVVTLYSAKRFLGPLL